MRFIVDCMLGKLSRWLRVLGFDAAYHANISDDDLIDLAIQENRVILTRDQNLFEKAKKNEEKPEIILIKSETWEEQIKQILCNFELQKFIKPFTRCLECNTPLNSIPKDEIRHLVPPFVFEHNEHFLFCKNCGRVFWKGTHFTNMQKKLKFLTE
ncbi:MAG: Mut7-C RNAse domain-containing protein [Syntrophales bacterium]|nr:Mut7-C RNAse domain-containing protein [Syntrophales bacterium]